MNHPGPANPAAPAGPQGTPAEPVKLEGFGPRDLYQKREKIFTRHIFGRFQKLRLFTGWPFLLGYFCGPWLTWDGRQAILFDLPARQFHLFGLTLWPQDLWLLGWLLMIAAFALFTVTTLVGRLWCGYTCPQTVWTAIFMWAEQITEGPRHQRIRLDAVPVGWTRAYWNKLRRRTAKHTLWLGWALLTAVTFVGYFTPIRELVTEFAAAHPWALFWTAFFTLATYINAGWMREQVCIYMCPYARFQSAMVDRDTLIVSYDPNRGEPRGSRKRGEASRLGDCIDCQLCVQVCPTGIDIRNGLQYQCIGCAHCIDACDQVMDKMGYAPGLISYTTENRLAAAAGAAAEPAPPESHWLRPRSVGYAVVCGLLISAFGYALWVRSPLAIDVLRERGELYHHMSDGAVRNDYQLKIMNKSQQPSAYTIALTSPADARLLSAARVLVAAGSVENVNLQAARPAPAAAAAAAAAVNVALEVRVCDQAGNCVTEETRFLAPAATP